MSLNGLIAAVTAVLAFQEVLIWAYKTWRDRDRDGD